MAHTGVQPAMDGLYNNMKVVVHQAVSVAQPIVSIANFAQKIEPILAVSIAKINGFSLAVTRPEPQALLAWRGKMERVAGDQHA